MDIKQVIQIAAIVIPILCALQAMVPLRNYFVTRENGVLTFSNLIQYGAIIAYFVLFNLGMGNLILTGAVIAITLSETISCITYWFDGKVPSFFCLLVNISALAFIIANYFV